jgi:hypothetical protein
VLRCQYQQFGNGFCCRWVWVWRPWWCIRHLLLVINFVSVLTRRPELIIFSLDWWSVNKINTTLYKDHTRVRLDIVSNIPNSSMSSPSTSIYFSNASRKSAHSLTPP